MNLQDAPTLVLRAIGPYRPPPLSRLHKLAIVSVMLMLFVVGFALGHRATLRQVETAPIVIAPRSMVRSEGASVRPEGLQADRALR